MASGNLIIVFGGSGSGKSTVLAALKSGLGERFVEGRKLSTRLRRQNDPIDMRVGQPKEAFQVCDIQYERYGHLYGITSTEIKEQLDAGKCFGLVIQDVHALRTTKRLFPNCYVWYVVRPLSEDRFRDISAQRQTPSDEVNHRLRARRSVHSEYVESLDLFDGVILNLGSEAQLVKLAIHQLNTSLGANGA